MPVGASQYNTMEELSRIFVMKGRLARVVPILGLDTYVHGRGRLVIQLLGQVTVMDGSGKEFDHSELLVWMNDAVFLAPSMLLSPAVSWEPVDSGSFDLVLTDGDQTVRGRVFLDDRGAPIDFHADRYATLPDGIVLTPWRTPVGAWQIVEGRPFPGPFSAIYDLANGPFCYLEGRFDPESIIFNVPPTAREGRPSAS